MSSNASFLAEIERLQGEAQDRRGIIEHLVEQTLRLQSEADRLRRLITLTRDSSSEVAAQVTLLRCDVLRSQQRHESAEVRKQQLTCVTLSQLQCILEMRNDFSSCVYHKMSVLTGDRRVTEEERE